MDPSQESTNVTNDNSLEDSPAQKIGDSPKVEFKLDYRGKDILLGLARWSKFVGIINIIFGFIYCLTIFVFSIPTVIMGIFLILLGAKLTSAAGNLKFSVMEEESMSFTEALDQLRSYMFLQSTMMIIVGLIIIVVLVIALMFGVAVKEFFYESTQNFSINFFQFFNL